MISEILGTLNILEKAGRFFCWLRKIGRSPSKSVSGRFIQLFESHDVHRNQIPRFFGHGLVIKDIQDETALLDKLEEPVLDAACSLFGVRREWLEGAEPQVYACHDFYKHPEAVAPFLTALKEKNPDGGLDGVLIAPSERAGDALIILSEVIGCVGEKPIYRHHLCNNWLFDYWKSRAYLTAFIAVAYKHGVYIRGGSLPSKEIKRLGEGEAMLVSKNGSSARRRGKLWHPEDMAIDPKNYLAGIDPEQNRFGLISALELWLRLENEGYMDTGLSMYPKANTRGLFEQALSRYQP